MYIKNKALWWSGSSRRKAMYVAQEVLIFPMCGAYRTKEILLKRQEPGARLQGISTELENGENRHNAARRIFDEEIYSSTPLHFLYCGKVISRRPGFFGTQIVQSSVYKIPVTGDPALLRLRGAEKNTIGWYSHTEILSQLSSPRIRQDVRFWLMHLLLSEQKHKVNMIVDRKHRLMRGPHTIKKLEFPPP